MHKILGFSVFFLVVACAGLPTAAPSPSPLPTGTVAVPTVPVTALSASPGLRYYWPASVPEGFVLVTPASSASATEFVVQFSNPPDGKNMILRGGPAAGAEYCPAGSVAQVIRGGDGCVLASTGTAILVEWKEADRLYSVSGLGLPQATLLEWVEQLEPLDRDTWQQRLTQ